MSINEPVWLIAEHIKKNPNDYTAFFTGGTCCHISDHVEYTICNPERHFEYEYEYSKYTVLSFFLKNKVKISETIRIPGIYLTEDEKELLAKVTRELLQIKEKEKEKEKIKLENIRKREERQERKRLTKLFGNV